MLTPTEAMGPPNLFGGLLLEIFGLLSFSQKNLSTDASKKLLG
jgi:hypothetical protein